MCCGWPALVNHNLAPKLGHRAAAAALTGLGGSLFANGPDVVKAWTIAKLGNACLSDWSAKLASLDSHCEALQSRSRLKQI